MSSSFIRRRAWPSVTEDPAHTVLSREKTGTAKVSFSEGGKWKRHDVPFDDLGGVRPKSMKQSVAPGVYSNSNDVNDDVSRHEGQLS